MATKVLVGMIPMNITQKPNGAVVQVPVKTLSTATNVKFTCSNNEYFCTFDDMSVINMDKISVANTIVNTLKTNLPNNDITIEFKYLFKYSDGTSLFNFDAGVAFVNLVSEITNICRTEEKISVDLSGSFIETVVNPVGQYQEENETDNDEDDETEEDEDGIIDLDKEFDPFSFLDDEDDDEEDQNYSPEHFNDMLDQIEAKHYKAKKKKESISRKEYGRSRVFKNANNPKRSYTRHGIIIAADKGDINADIKIMKAFLKDFIPGNQEWKKKLRNDLLKRWISSYCVTKKEIKKLEKDYNKKRNQKKASIKTAKTLDFTKRLFTVPVDSWDNPNK